LWQEKNKTGVCTGACQSAVLLTSVRISITCASIHNSQPRRSRHPIRVIRGKILPTASAISLKLAKRLTRSALQASARTRHNRPYPNHLRSRSQLTTHYSQLRRSRHPIRVHPWKNKRAQKPCASAPQLSASSKPAKPGSRSLPKRRKQTKFAVLNPATICIPITCAAALYGRLLKRRS
jgi:hypothetical protein